MPTEEIVIEFTAEYSSLEGALDKLEKAGAVDTGLANSLKKTTAEFNKLDQAAKKTSTALQGPVNSIDQLDKRSRQFVDQFLKGFEEGVRAELIAAKKDIDEMRKKLEEAGSKGGTATKSLKVELKELRQQIEQIAKSGGPVPQSMIDRAGELEDTIGDVAAAIKKAGSDTRGLDSVLGSVQALAGGFAVAQGAIGLFGDESKDMEKALVKVNQTMLILQGLQAVTNALLKEGAISQLAINTQQAIANTQLILNTAATSANVVVKYAAIAAQKALNLVLSLNPYAAIISLILVLITQMDNWAASTRATAAANADLDLQLKKTNETLADNIDFVNDLTEKQIIQADRVGKSQLHILELQRNGLEENQRLREEQFEANKRALADQNGDEEKHAQLVKDQAELEKQISKGKLDILKNDAAIGKQMQKDLDDAHEKFLANEEKRLATQKQTSDDKKEADAKAAAAEAERQKNQIAATEEQILLNQITGKSTKVLQIELIGLQAQYESLGKSAEEASLIQAKAILKVQDVLSSGGFKANLDESKESLIDTTKALQNFGTGSIQVINEAATETKKTFKQFIDGILPDIEAGLTVLSTLQDGLSAISNEQRENAQIAIESQRAQVDALLEAGSITEKEAKARQKRLDSEEKKLQRKQAQREKQQALFGAFLNMAQGIVGSFRLLPPYNYINAALVAAIGAAQIAAISSRPIPNFRTGKKGSWEGFGRYGEAGAELRVNADGRMQYVTKPTVDYIGPKDIIYNPAETKEIMAAANARSARAVERIGGIPGMDYDKLGAAVGKNSKQPHISINIDKQFIRESVAAGLSNKNFLDQRYSFRK